MGSSIDFYCGPSDTNDITEYALSIGLNLISPTTIREITKSASESGPYALLSTAPQADLVPVGVPPVDFTDACHPVLTFMRAFYEEPYLVLGHVYWSNDNKDMAKITQPYFRKIVTWVRKNWAKTGDFYNGPEAVKLLHYGAEKVNFLPGSVKETFISLP